ncbi:MAG TPA: hypothetical protein VFZ58_02150 [Candidatus Saccharimonadales bacterium]
MQLFESEAGRDEGRWLRDQAHESFKNGDEPSKWHKLASTAVAIHTIAFSTKLSSPSLRREYAASVAMRARLGQRHELAGNQPYGGDDILDGLHYAMAELRKPGRPDQYEINFVAAAAFREATHGSRFEALRLTARSALIAFCSESPLLACETNPDLSTTERWKAKGRALGRTAIAAIGTTVGSQIKRVTPFTRLASKLL